MGIKYEVVPATWNHAIEVAVNMRRVDCNEVWATGHYTPAEAVTKSLSASRDTGSAGLVDGVPVMLFGIASQCVNRVGCPWMLATPGLEKHPKAFVKMSKAWLDERIPSYDLLHNWVHAKNVTSIRWLRWLGFELDDAVHFGPDRELFHHFYMEIGHADDQASQPAA